MLSLPDLVKVKKTQRDKDWPMIRRLVDAHYARHRQSPDAEQVSFWLRQSYSASLLIEVAGRFPNEAAAALSDRPLVALAIAKDAEGLAAALEQEEKAEREADRAYWRPLKAELEQLRHQWRKEKKV